MPPLTSLEDELAEEEKVLRAEQEWFLATQVKPGLENIQKALLACQDAARLQDDTKGALTLAISTTSNDTLKGFVTLAGSFIVKGDLTIKLPKLPVVKATIHSHVPSKISASTPPVLQTAATPNTGSSTAASSSSSSSSSTTGVSMGGEGAQAINVEYLHTEEGGLESSKDDKQKKQQADIQGSNQILQQALGTQSPHQLLHSYRPPGHLTQPYFLEQLKDVQNHTDQAIYKLEDYWRYFERNNNNNNVKGESLDLEGKDHHVAEGSSSASTSVTNKSIETLKTLLQLMQRHLREAIQAMTQPRKEKLYPFRVCDPKIFSPALSEDFVIEFYIRDSQMVCAAYALQLSSGGNSTNTPGSSALVSYLQQALPGASTPSQQASPLAAPAAPTISVVGVSSTGHSTDGHQYSSSNPPPPTQTSSQTIVAHGGAKSGTGTPRPTSPQHHHTSSTQPSHQRQLSSSGQLQSHSGAKSFPWSPSRTLSTTDYNQSASAGPPPNEAVVLPPSSKIGQTTKGGINKYRGKVATTMEDKVVQVQSPKLTEISVKLVHAETLCRRLLQFLTLQESVAAYTV